MSTISELHMDMFYHFWSLIDYFSMILDNTQSISNNEVETRLKDISEPQKQYFVTEELHDYFLNEFPHLTTSSIIISLFSRIEVYSRKLCNEIENRDTINIKYKDLHGSILDKTKEYFKQNNLPGYEIEFHEIFCNIQKIRDCFVHCNGDINESRDKEYLQNLMKNGKIKVINNSISVNVDYCRLLLIMAKDAMISIYKESGFPMIIE